MPVFDPKTLAADCGGVWHGFPLVPPTGFGMDTRTLAAGEIFVALTTGRRDGHDFLAEAAMRGASAALVSRHVSGSPLPQLLVDDTLQALQALARAHRARFAKPVVAVTGSAGKTSTKDLLAVLLSSRHDVLATQGNLNNHIGVPLTLLRLDPAKHRAAVVEAGISGPGEMDVIASLIAPDVAVITMVGPAHLDGLGSVTGVANEKARLAAHLREGGVAVFPASCCVHEAFRAIPAPMLVATPAGFDLEALPARARAVPFVVQHAGEGTQLCLTWEGSVEEFDFRRVSAGMAGNAALALAAALRLGIPADKLRRRITAWRPAALRGEVVRHGETTFYLDCYNANPASMLDALETFTALAPADAPRLFVVGCMEELGAESAALHRGTGERWPMRAGDRLIVFGTQAEDLAAGVRDRHAGADILVNPERPAAAEALRAFRGAVFLKGSRRYALETLLDGGLAVHGHGARAHEGGEVRPAC
ncbi:MAG: UDP-N-acetylmuramoyl-tripeptide--D-alanyl-D-alanine ligase [Opitutaceae bacterium]|nr:UDP-N-acetylmuramoyl-tripeptide--D-alanyl-D-alanine ligase [Opitutaceae bacterium]